MCRPNLLNTEWSIVSAFWRSFTFSRNSSRSRQHNQTITVISWHSFIWSENTLGYLSADINCSEKRTVFRGRSSRKPVSFEEQIMSKDKYPSIFSQPNWGYCVYYPSVLKIGEYLRIFHSFSRGIFAQVMRLVQSRVSENLWCIVILNICVNLVCLISFFICCKAPRTI